MEKYQPVPIRKVAEWKHIELFDRILTAQGKELLDARANIICRECYGFGHSRTNCPTRRKLDIIAMLDPVSGSGVGKFRYASAAKKSRVPVPVWPAVTEADEFIQLT